LSQSDIANIWLWCLLVVLLTVLNFAWELLLDLLEIWVSHHESGIPTQMEDLSLIHLHITHTSLSLT
jgi:hypothetical protein